MPLQQYVMVYLMLLLPAHWRTRARPRLHIALLASIAISYLILVWFAFPIRGLPL